MKKYLLYVIVTLVVSACGANSSQSDNTHQLALKTEDAGSVPPSNPINTPTVFIIRTEAEWTTFWGFSATVPTFMPAINFNESMFIAIVDGTKTVTGHSIAITEVQTSSSGITVHAVENSPGTNCSVQSWVNQPFYIVSTANIPGSATLDLTQKTTDCTSQIGSHN